MYKSAELTVLDDVASNLVRGWRGRLNIFLDALKPVARTPDLVLQGLHFVGQALNRRRIVGVQKQSYGVVITAEKRKQHLCFSREPTVVSLMLAELSK